MNFAYGHMLWLLLVVPPLLLGFFWWAGRDRQRRMTQFIEARLLPGLTSGVSPTRQKVRFAMLTAAVTLLLIALARPQWGFTWEESKQKGLDIVVAIDTSKSMLAEDIAPNRLARAKLAALDLMQQAKSDRLGLVAFAGGAFLQCPLTIDDNAFRQSVEALDVNIIPQGGTAVAEAVTTALTAFKEGDNFKVLVLFTDGEDNDENAVSAAQAAAKEGMKIFTIGIGTAEGELLRVKDAKGRTDYIRDTEGNVVKSRLNEGLLQQIAGATEGGFYLPMRGAKTIDALYEKGLAPLPKSEGQEKLVKRMHERYHWPLGLAMAFLLIEMLMPERKRDKQAGNKELPRSNSPAQDKAAHAPVSRVTAAMILGLGLSVLPFTGIASPASAMKDYSAGQYTNALTEYERLLAEQTKAQKPEDPRLHFNAGTAAFRATNYPAALQHFNSVLAAPDIRLQQKAYYNLGNTQFRLGQAAEDLDKLQEAWEEAIKQYQHAVMLDKADQSATFNLAWVESAVEQIKLMRELAKRAKAEADAATRQRNYRRALEIMEQIMQGNLAAKPFEDFTKKLKDIDAITNPRQP
ncbi:MAG: VWA domain-containing protein [Verrucomicrobiota bacterium]|nr:VWA domain-containing protein [Limisphaerales bacterium]